MAAPSTGRSETRPNTLRAPVRILRSPSRPATYLALRTRSAFPACPTRQVNPGARNISNLCEPGSAGAGLTSPNITTEEYYCDSDLTSEQFCQVKGDNILVIDRPDTQQPEAFKYNVRQHPAGATIKYTYPIEAVVSGVAW